MESRSFPDDRVDLRSPLGGAPAAALAGRPAWTLGGALIDPASRRLAGPAGNAVAEPRVMQVLTALADAKGDVVTRDALIAGCWNGLIVGDDAINRAIGAARKLLRAVGSTATIATVPKTGYRLVIPEARAPRPGSIPRRATLGAAAALLVAGVGGVWLTGPAPRDRRASALIADAKQALIDDQAGSTARAVAALTQATRIAPDDAEAWGQLARAWSREADYAAVDGVAAAVSACQAAARSALAIDRDQPDALAALAMLRPIFGDWTACEARLRAVLARTPDHVETLGALGVLLYSVGRTREAAALNRRAVALEPLSPIYQYRGTYHLWSLGDVGAADRMIDRASQLWPRHPGVWFARLLLLSGTGRLAPAMAMLAGAGGVQPVLPPPAIAQWQASLAVLAGGAGRGRAVAGNLDAARASSGGAVQAILLLAMLGEIDAAFMVADGFLLRRGPVIGTLGSVSDQPIVNEQRWRKTMMLFNPVTGPMRVDRRFATLCRDMGMQDYWRRAGVRPDHLNR